VVGASRSPHFGVRAGYYFYFADELVSAPPGAEAAAVRAPMLCISPLHQKGKKIGKKMRIYCGLRLYRVTVVRKALSYCFVLGRNGYVGQTEGAPYAPQLASAELSTAQQRSAAAAQRSGSAAQPAAARQHCPRHGRRIISSFFFVHLLGLRE
jgi:hypothetical protein